MARRTAELFGRLARHRGRCVDLVEEFTAVLPRLVIVDILGVPDRDVPRTKQSADGQIVLVWGQPDPDDQVRLPRACSGSGATLRISSRSGPPVSSATNFASKALRFRGGRDAALVAEAAASMPSAANLRTSGDPATS